MEFMHYNATKKKLTIDAAYRSPICDMVSFVHYKPYPCIWLSVGTQWKEWVKREGYRVDKYRFGHRVRVNGAKLIKIGNIKAMRKFTEKYGVKHRFDDDVTIDLIDWALVIRDNLTKSGILVMVNNMVSKLEYHHWVRIFDVDSAALWDARCLIV